MSKPISQSQSRRYCGISYLSKDILLSLFENKNAISYYSFIYHDKDIITAKDGTQSLKPPHYHLILLLKYPQLKRTVSNWFRGWEDENGPINTFIEPMTDLDGSFRYFTHKDDPDKYQYNDTEIISNDILYFRNLISNDNDYTEDKLYIGLDMYMNGENPRTIAYKLGRDFIIHFRSIKELAQEIYDFEYREQLKQNKIECEKRFNEKKRLDNYKK